jgi:hypothetical protein
MNEAMEPAEDGAYTDAQMLGAVATAGRAYKERVDQDEQRLAGLEDRITGLLIFDEQEARELYDALGTRQQSSISTPLYKQLGDWLHEIETDEAAA